MRARVSIDRRDRLEDSPTNNALSPWRQQLRTCLVKLVMGVVQETSPRAVSALSGILSKLKVLLHLNFLSKTFRVFHEDSWE